MGPYSHSLTPIADISRFFRKDDAAATLTFIGETLELRIPKRFSTHGALVVGDGSVTTLGVFDMIIDGAYQTGFNLLASITMTPNQIGQMTYKGIDYLVVHLVTGNVFMTSTNVLQDPNVVYVLWTEFITSGNIPYHFTYQSLLRIFEHARELTGSGIGVSRSVFEGIIAHLCRDKDRPSLQYRLTDMTGEMRFIALNSVSLAPSSTTARLNGAYMTSDGLTSALRFQVDEHQPFENLLRGLGNPSTVADVQPKPLMEF